MANKRPVVATGTRVSSHNRASRRWDSSDAFKGLIGRPIPKKAF